MPAIRRAGRQLSVVVGGALLILLVLLLPDLRPPPTDESAPVQAFHGRRVEILEGARTGEVLDAFLEGPAGSQVVALYEPGDEVVLAITSSGTDVEPYVSVADRWRVVPLQLLVGLFALAVVVVGGWHGVRALVALGLTIAVISKILLPLVLQGVPPLPMAVVGASAITAATILLTEGPSRGSIAAILGTAGALSVAGLLASVATAAAGFTYAAGADLAFLETQGGAGLDLRGILLAAIILGAVGVLDDVTVTQAVVVQELAERGSLRGRSLFASALGIGRSHIGATVNTLFLAYVGASLPLLVVLLVGRQPPELVYNNEVIATEVVRTIAGSIGIVAAVPLTTFIATLLVGRATVAGDPAGAQGAAAWRPVAAIAAVVAVLLVATALLPATQTGRAPLPTEPPFVGPSEDPAVVPPPSGAGPGEPAGSGDPAAPEPLLADRGEPVPISVGGAQVGTAAVTRWSVSTVDGRRAVLLEVTYAAVDDWTLDGDAWEILTADGGEVPFVAAPPLPPTLAAGETRTFTLRAQPDGDLTDSFIAYVDATSEAFVFLVALE